jgi:hypothetical protein
MELSLSWVPAHGRHPEWTPCPLLPLAAEAIRKLNDTADHTATSTMEQRRVLPDFVHYDKARRRARQWKHAALLQALRMVPVVWNFIEHEALRA